MANYKINYIFNLIFKEFFFKKKLTFDWSIFPKRYEIINEIILKKNFKDYLEIGCFTDENFNKIKVKNKVGVDPIQGGNIRKTSDEYFKSCEDFFDIIFIDGLHHYDQVKKDILNSLKILKTGGVILIHDCLPRKARDQMVPRSHEEWNGDVWKSIVEFRTKDDIDTYVCYADHGLGLILNRKNKNKLDLNIKNFKKLKFSDYYKNHKKFMNIINHKEIFKVLD
tara:strand:- start:78 stop:749 length:672 start_codon:yes stop_codon:yes gene_type:complete